MHRQEGTGTAANHVTVTAHADAGVFPEGTSMKVTAASSDSAMQAAEKLLDSLHIHRIKILMFSYLYKPHYKVIMKYSFDEELHKNAPSFF